MEVLKIATDNPRLEQWKMLSRFSYPPNIKRLLAERGVLRPRKKLINYISGYIRQGEAYFSAALAAPLDISPLLLYYGATNLASGALTLISAKIPDIRHHGMTVPKTAVDQPRIGDHEVRFVQTTHGAIQAFTSAFDPSGRATRADVWSIKEILGSIPALSTEFGACFENDLPSCLRTRRVNDSLHGIDYSYDEIPMLLLRLYGDEYATLLRISDWQAAYLPPVINTPNREAKLYYKRDGKDIGIYSIFGEKYLPLSHSKNGRFVCPSQLTMMMMGMYCLGYISRYRPGAWNPFVRADETGERLVVEKFLTICHRFFPNLVLNFIENARVQFVFEIERETKQ